MAKTYRVTFEKGINVVGDKPILPVGFATVLDNVDLRSGSARCFKAPVYQFQTPLGTTRSWEYRGRWFHAPSWRDYVGQYIGSIERVYWTQEGFYPQKAIEGTQVTLGTPRPQTILGVSDSTILTPPSLIATVSATGGSLPATKTYYYRVAAKTADGVMSPCAAVSATTGTASGGSIVLAWGSVDTALSYIIFRGVDSANCFKMAEINGSILIFSDAGGAVPGGDLASSYDQTQPFTYAYTYVRSVNGVLNESGMSFNTPEFTGEHGRLITRDIANDGYLSQQVQDPITGAFKNTAITVPGCTFNASITDYPVLSLIGATLVFNNSLDQVTITLQAVHGLVTDDKIYLTGFTDPKWNAKTFKIIYISTTAFAIQNIGLPYDGSTLATGFAQPVKTKIAYTSTSSVSTNDSVYITIGSTSGWYKATYVDATHFYVPILSAASGTATIQWVPGNGYYRYWNIYRNEQGGWFLVNQCDIWDSTFTDSKPFSALGGPPSSYYMDNFQIVDYDIPPFSLTSLEEHYGMLFGVDGHNVRWTPILASDAWPRTFFITMPYKPVALASYAQGLIVLCQDALYRIDGNTPTGFSLSKTLTEDGCIAPHSVQKTQNGLIYLSRRGLMIFDGQHARCISDMKVPPQFLSGPSTVPSPVPFWWFLTTTTRNYNDLAGEDSIKGSEYTWTLDNTKPIEGVINGIKSFYHNGKYYLFYTGANYAANTALCVDLQLESLPMTTLGMKALDAHVSDTNIAYVLFDNSAQVTTVTITSPV